MDRISGPSASGRALGAAIVVLGSVLTSTAATRIPSVSAARIPKPAIVSETVSLVPTRDNTLFEDPGGALSDGAGSFLYVGRTNSGVARRALIYFDLACIPPDAVVQSATLTMHLKTSSPGFPSSGDTVSVFRVREDWGEGASDAGDPGGSGAPSAPGDATWIHRFYPDSASLWASVGGDFALVGSSSLNVLAAPGAYSWTGTGLSQDVQSWLQDSESNHGWILKDQETNGIAERFDSRENAGGTGPTLSVTFTVDQVSGACCSIAGCQTLSAAACTGVGGAYQGDGSRCCNTICAPPPTGACCAADASCSVGTSADCAGVPGTYQGDGSSCVAGTCSAVLQPYVDALPRPVIAQPIVGQPGGEASYEIAMRQFSVKFHRDLPPTTVWGYGNAASVGGSIPGPTIEARRDQTVTVKWINDLRDENGDLRSDHYLPVDPCPHGAGGREPRTVVHLHGAHVRPDSDGFPERTLLPGQSVLYHYPNHQYPTTLWYHDHALGTTRLNVYMGLASFYLIRDDVEAGLGLPSGEFEVPLMIMDRTFRPDGSLAYPPMWMEHFFGDTIVVNGKAWPYMDVRQGYYRFRIVNASNSRTYTLAPTPPVPILQIGSDGGLLLAPVPVTSTTIAPGERVDLVVDFRNVAAGTHIELINSAPVSFPGTPGDGVIRDVMEFRVLGEPGVLSSIPAALRPVPVLHESDAVDPPRDFELNREPEPEHCGDANSMWVIKSIQGGIVTGMHWDEIVDYPKLGTTEVWRFFNRSNLMHAMHVHLVQAQLLDSQRFEVASDNQPEYVGPPVPSLPEEAGWKDTFQVPPQTVTRVIMRFADYSGPYPLHCHLLEHEDHEMMRQFQVTECGNGILDPDEQCDDGNTKDGDCCSATCRFEPAGGICTDGNACTTGDSCHAGICSPGGPANCDDGNCCTIDACVPATGCTHTANTTAPVFTQQPTLGACAVLWPPNHGYADFTVATTRAAAIGACGIASIQFASCNSSQPEDGTGRRDGDSIRDCVYEPGVLHLRAERDGACGPIGRVYTSSVVATDVCGNRTTSDPFDVGVWNDRGHAPTAGPVYSASPGSNTNDTRAGVNGAYASGCGSGNLTCGRAVR